MVFVFKFPISRDPPEGGTPIVGGGLRTRRRRRFQFLGIPPKGERKPSEAIEYVYHMFPISRDPPEGGTVSCSDRYKGNFTVSNF